MWLGCFSGQSSHFPLLALNLFFPTLQKWKFSCFRHEDFSSETPKLDYVEHYLPGEPVKPEFEKPNTSKKDWKTTFREVTSFVIFCVVGFGLCHSLLVHSIDTCTAL